MEADLRQRKPPTLEAHTIRGVADSTMKPDVYELPAFQHGSLSQTIRALALFGWFMCVCFVVHTIQLLGAGLYFINRDYYYTYMALTKQSFGMLITTITQWFAPTKIRISGERAVREQMQISPDGRHLELHFPDRLVMISNHQLYTDWLYLWWLSYTNNMHGHIFIILKESLKYVPIIGPGMMFFGFIFMARNWATDKLRLQHRLSKLKSRHGGPLTGNNSLDPMWLLIYPEGTNLSANTRHHSAAWSAKSGIPDFEHQILPRSTGLQYCLQELGDTVEWVYDCTVAYDGIPKGQYGQDIFTLGNTYLRGRAPPCVNMHWRRFAIKDMPLHDEKLFATWVLDRWKEKEAILQYREDNGRFPGESITGQTNSVWAPSSTAKEGDISDDEHLECHVELKSWAELVNIFLPLVAWGLVANIGAKMYNFVAHGSMLGAG